MTVSQIDSKNGSAHPFRYLALKGIGPTEHLIFEPGERLTLLTGDNGLGKTFLLDCLMWAVSARWPGLEARPQQHAKSPRIIIDSPTVDGIQQQRLEFSYSYPSQSWTEDVRRPAASTLAFYAKADGSIAFWDPHKEAGGVAENGIARPLWNFSEREIWEGVRYQDTQTGFTKHLCNGLIEDWINWQYRSSSSPFRLLKRVLSHISAPDLHPFSPGKPTRLPNDTREMPTLRLPYGETPILHTSAGIRRILSLAYLLIWLWDEHKKIIAQKRVAPLKQMLIMIDEVEAHLHPKWQRVIVPAFMEVIKELDKELHAQFVIATHSPLVLASVEPHWNETTDKFYLLNLNKSGKVVLEETPFDAYGEVDNWLTSYKSSL